MNTFFILLLAYNWHILVQADEVTINTNPSAEPETEPLKRDEALNEYFRDILAGLKIVMPTGLDPINLPVLDPLHLGGKFLSYRTEPTRLEAHFNNVSIKGLSLFKILDLNVDIPRLQILLKVKIPDLVADGLYNLTGMAMYVLPLRGFGPWHVHLINLTVTALVKMQYNQHNDLRLRMLSLIGDVDDSRIQFENLIDKGGLGKVINRILQVNSRRLLNEGLKELRGTLEHAVAQYTNVLDAEFILEMSASNSSITQTP